MAEEDRPNIFERPYVGPLPPKRQPRPKPMSASAEDAAKARAEKDAARAAEHTKALHRAIRRMG